MLQFDAIARALHSLTEEEKLKLRSLLDGELRSGTDPKEDAPPKLNGAKSSKQIVGLFADEPELLDRVMEAVYERRSRPTRPTQ